MFGLGERIKEYMDKAQKYVADSEIAEKIGNGIYKATEKAQKYLQEHSIVDDVSGAIKEGTQRVRDWYENADLKETLKDTYTEIQKRATSAYRDARTAVDTYIDQHEGLANARDKAHEIAGKVKDKYHKTRELIEAMRKLTS